MDTALGVVMQQGHALQNQESAQDANFTHASVTFPSPGAPVSDTAQAPTPTTPPTPNSAPASTPVPAAAPSSALASTDGIMKAVHRNARHRMAPKKTVVKQMCEICNIELIGQVVIDAHMKGSKHAKKLKAKELLSSLIDAGQVRIEGTPGDKAAVYTCDACNVTLNSTHQLEVHYAGAKHKAKVSEGGNAQYQDGASAAASGTESSADSTSINAKFEKSKMMPTNPLDLVCTICNINVNSPQQLEQHLNSKKHQDREAGRTHQRPSPYSRGGGRGGRGGLGSNGRSGKSIPQKFTNLSNSFKSAGYSNTFIKPEGGVIMPPNCGANKGLNQPGSSQQNHAKASNFTGQHKNKGNFGSLTPYVNTDNSRGGYNARGGAARGGWFGSGAATHSGYTGFDYEQYGYGYGYTGYENTGYENTGYDNTGAYGGYGMMPSGPPPTY